MFIPQAKIAWMRTNVGPDRAFVAMERAQILKEVLNALATTDSPPAREELAKILTSVGNTDTNALFDVIIHPDRSNASVPLATLWLQTAFIAWT